MYPFIECLLVFIILSCVLFSVFFHVKKKKICCKLRNMSCEEKCNVLAELIRPFGYCYDPSSDAFSTRIDAPQRSFGYTALYDRYAERFHMVFDCAPVYFDYDGKSWLIELWKGQYGINTGGEVGIYRTDSLIPSVFYRTTLFHSVDDTELLPLSLLLFRNGRPLARLSKKHWWLTVFCMGEFTNPKDLSMQVSITFPNPEMLQAFAEGVKEQPSLSARYCGSRALITFQKCPSCRLSLFRRLLRCFRQFQNQKLCKLYLWATGPFERNLKRLLCLYYLLPSAFRHLLRSDRRKKKYKKYGRKEKSHEKSL